MTNDDEMAEDFESPEPPEELNEAGLRLWEAVNEHLVLTEAELAILRAACSTADILARLSREVADCDLTTYNAKGERISNPALVEHRFQSQSLQRAIASLRLPDDLGAGGEDELNRPSKRNLGGARGSYGIRGAV